MEEIWLPVRSYEGLYEVSSFGNVRSLDRLVYDKNNKRKRLFKGKILQNVCANTGYHMVSLHRNNKRIARRTVHRLIMEVFNPIDNPQNMIVDHVNGNRADNRLENLRWVDYNTNNRNTPYIRYLQRLLNKHNIEYIKEDSFGS